MNEQRWWTSEAGRCAAAQAIRADSCAITRELRLCRAIIERARPRAENDRGVQVAVLEAVERVAADGTAGIQRSYRGLAPTRPVGRLVIASQIVPPCDITRAVIVDRDETGIDWRFESYTNELRRITYAIRFAEPWKSGELDVRVRTCQRYSTDAGPGEFGMRVKDPTGELRLRVRLPEGCTDVSSESGPVARAGDDYLLVVRNPAVGSAHLITWRSAGRSG